LSEEIFHQVPTNTYATVILPIAVPKPYTYYVPTEMQAAIQMGVRVEVQFGKNKLYAALVIEVHDRTPEDYKPKPIQSVIDNQPIVNATQLKLWNWMADYYACRIGEVMNAALPANLKLASETKVLLSPVFDDNYNDLNDKEFMIAEALSIQNELSVEDIRKILDQKTVYPIIHRLLEKRVIYLKEEIKTRYKPKMLACVELQEPYASEPELLEGAFDLLKRSDKQQQALLAFIQLDKKQDFIRKQDIYKAANVDSGVLKAMEKKGIFSFYDKEVSRVKGYEDELMEIPELSTQQEAALNHINHHFEDKSVALLHGVTGSGKTRVYIELMREAIKKGEQVLYLLPEIALTTQIISRLEILFGDNIAVYHSRLSNNERVDVWKTVLAEKPIILGVRSSMFLPFNNLKLIIVDEEHDASYKQIDPAPRYNARDTAIYLAHLHQAKIVLGTATPSLESYHNAIKGKYGLVEMPDRFGGIQMPEIVIVDKKDEHKKRKMQSHFTSVLIEELKKALANGEQAILFQNRRGYSPTLRCSECGWHSECKNCDVSLTYHKFHNNLQCHYCGYHQYVAKECPACASKQLNLKGFGTEKIEDELKIYFPDAKIGRMDFDTVKTKHGYARIINDFEERRLDILVGTQMVTKGLDFDNVSVVGVLSADQQLQYPYFRASERAFQLITQVSGRAGRKLKRGKVIVQAFDVTHPVIKEVLNNNYQHFFNRELLERKDFKYPPFIRLIKITLKHKKPQNLNDGTKLFSQYLKDRLGHRVIGPAIPSIPRVRNQYLMDVMVKLEKNGNIIAQAKSIIHEAIAYMQSAQGCSQIRANIDVDPY